MLRLQSFGPTGKLANGRCKSPLFFHYRLSVLLVSPVSRAVGEWESGNAGVGFWRLQMHLLSHQQCNGRRRARSAQDGMPAFIPRTPKCGPNGSGRISLGHRAIGCCQYHPSVRIFRPHGGARDKRKGTCWLRNARDTAYCPGGGAGVRHHCHFGDFLSCVCVCVCANRVEPTIITD